MIELGGLERLPGSPQLHRWADWAEIQCLQEGRLTAGDISESVDSASDSLANDLHDDPEPDVHQEDPLGATFASADQFNDAITTRATDVFAYLEARGRAYGDAYPFDVDTVRRTLSTRLLRQDRETYIFLLLCASLRYVPQSAHRTNLANRFELISLAAFKRCMPTTAEVYLFGSNPLIEGPFTGLLRDKIGLLVAMLRETLLVDLEKEFDDKNFGDNGLDLVAWTELGDMAPGMLSAFAQCACTPKWVEKQHSSSADQWSAVFRATVSHVNYCFMPFDFRRPDGDWYARHSIHGSLLMDRRRLMLTLGFGNDGRASADLQSSLSALPAEDIRALVAPAI